MVEAARIEIFAGTFGNLDYLPIRNTQAQWKA